MNNFIEGRVKILKGIFEPLKGKIAYIKDFLLQNKELEEINLERNGLGNFLIQKGIITEEQLKKALDYQDENTNKKIGEILFEINILGEEEALKELANYMNVQYVVLNDLAYPLTLQNLFKKKNMLEYLFVPFDFSGNTICIAVSDINNIELKQKIQSAVNKSKVNYNISFYLSLPSMIKRFIYNSYSKYPHLTSKRKKFGEYLVEKHIVTKEQISEILKYQQKFVHKRLGELLCEMKILEREQALKELACHENKEYEPLNNIEQGNELIRFFDINFMKENYFIPFEKEDNIIKIAVNNIFDDDLMEEIETKLNKHGLKAKFYISLREAIENCIKRLEMQ